MAGESYTFANAKPHEEWGGESGITPYPGS
jgi:hypothetical protein